MLVKDLIQLLLNLEQEKEIDFRFSTEGVMSYTFGHSGELDTNFDEIEDGKIVFGIAFDEDNIVND